MSSSLGIRRTDSVLGGRSSWEGKEEGSGITDLPPQVGSAHAYLTRCCDRAPYYASGQDWIHRPGRFVECANGYLPILLAGSSARAKKLARSNGVNFACNVNFNGTSMCRYRDPVTTQAQVLASLADACPVLVHLVHVHGVTSPRQSSHSVPNKIPHPPVQ